MVASVPGQRSPGNPDFAGPSPAAMLCPWNRNAFTPLPEDWDAPLAVVAHPDDMEFGAAAAVARWTGQGKTVIYAMVTQRRGRIDGMEPEQCRAVRERRRSSSASVVGVDVVDFLGFQDGIIEYGVPLRRAIAEVVARPPAGHRDHRQLRGHLGGRNLNQADHIAVGRAVLDAVRDAGNRWIFNDQLTDGLEPWGGVKAVCGLRVPGARHAVDTTDTFDAGVESLRAHQAYIDGLGWENFDPREMLEGFAAGRTAPGRGVRRAVRGVLHGLGRASQRKGRTGAPAVRPSGLAPPVELEPLFPTVGPRWTQRPKKPLTCGNMPQPMRSNGSFLDRT